MKQKYTIKTIRAITSPSSGVTAPLEDLAEAFAAEKDLGQFGRTFQYRLLVGAMAREYRAKLRDEAEQALGRPIAW